MDSKKKIKSILGALKPKKASKNKASKSKSSKTSSTKATPVTVTETKPKPTVLIKPPPPPPSINKNTNSRISNNSFSEYDESMFHGTKDHYHYHPDLEDAKHVEAIEKELDRKIEQAPAAKVIVSDDMMREALTEIGSKSRRSSRSIVGPRLNNDILPKDPGPGGDGDASTSIRNQVQQEQQQPNILGSIMEEEGSMYGCPLDKILEFLQAVMIKDYKRALVLGKEVAQLEPNNELIQEFVVVLKKIVKKEREDEAQETDSDSVSEAEGDGVQYSDEMTTSSSETESDSSETDSSEDNSWSSTSSSSEEEAKPQSAPEFEEKIQKV